MGSQKKFFKLDKTKASQKINILTRIIKENSDIFVDFLCKSINSAIKSSSFPSSLKLAEVTLVHEKGRNDMKEKFRPVSILPTLSNIFEKSIFAQMSTFFDSIFLNQECNFRKGYNTQHYLLLMLETWKRSVDKGKVFGALLTVLSKAFDCLNHELPTAKLNAYAFSLPGLQQINDYLSNRKQLRIITVLY